MTSEHEDVSSSGGSCNGHDPIDAVTPSDFGAWAAGQLSDQRRLVVDHALEVCDRCRTLWQQWVDASSSGSGTRHAMTEVTRQLTPTEVDAESGLAAEVDGDRSSGSAGGTGVDPGVLPEIPDFEIKGRIGGGGMGDVYLARDLNLQVNRALKIPRSMRHDSREEFLKEARALARVRHPNIVPVHSYGESGDQAYFVMEYIQGRHAGELIELFRSHQAHELPGEEVLRLAGVDEKQVSRLLLGAASRSKGYYNVIATWIAQAAEGLQRAHHSRVLHRDIKPSNLLLSRAGQLMVADFGLARPTGDDSRSGSWSVTGTYPYTAPEKATGDWAAADHRADIWALGATLYEFLTYRRAYPRAGRDVLQDIATKDPDPPSSHVKDVPSELEAICLRAMDRSPSDRYQSARAMAEDLYRFVGRPHGRAVTPLTLALSMASVAVVIGVIALVWGGFGEGDTGTDRSTAPVAVIAAEPESGISSLVLRNRQLTVVEGQTEQLTVLATMAGSTAAEAIPQDVQLEYTSEDQSVAVVNLHGAVMAKASGETRIIVSAVGLDGVDSVACDVKVVRDVVEPDTVVVTAAGGAPAIEPPTPRLPGRIALDFETHEGTDELFLSVGEQAASKFKQFWDRKAGGELKLITTSDPDCDYRVSGTVSVRFAGGRSDAGRHGECDIQVRCRLLRCRGGDWEPVSDEALARSGTYNLQPSASVVADKVRLLSGELLDDVIRVIKDDMASAGSK